MNNMKRGLYIFLSIAQLGHAMSLNEACYRGNVAEVKKLLASNPDQINERKNGFLPIHFAAYACSLEIITLLLDAKPELVNEPDVGGNVPCDLVFLAITRWREAVEKREEELEKLVREGKLPRIPDGFERSNTKRKQLFRQVIELLIERGADLDGSDKLRRRVGLSFDEEFGDYARLLILIKEEESDGK